jgi:hypothetical protein
MGALLGAFGCQGAGPDSPQLDARPGPLDAAVEAGLDARAEEPPLDASVLAFEPLVDNERWRRYDAAVDPLRSHQPPEIQCYASATYSEFGSFEIDTTRCNYLLAETPALLAVEPGADLRIELLHFDLFAPAPAQAHVAVLFGDVLQWEDSIAIPAPGNQVTATFRSRSALGFQDPIRLHLHNHGGNQYLLVALEVARATP